MSNINISSTAMKPGNNSVNNANDKEQDSYVQAMYIACEIAGCFLLIATMYILVCLLVFGNKSGRWKSSRKKSDVNRGTVYTAAFIAIALTIPRYVANQLLFNAHNIPNGLQYCETLLDIGNVCYFTSMTAVYIFLWIRQRALYAHPAMRRLAGKYVNYISWATLVILTGAGIAVLLWFVIPDDYTHSKNGCVVIPVSINSTAENSSYSMLDYIVLLGLLIIAQVSLLGLFIYPMVRSSAIQSQSLRRSSKHKNVMMFVTKNNETVVTNKKSNPALTYIRQIGRKTSCSPRRKCTIQRTIRRTVICAAISMVSDLATMIIATLAIPSDIPRSLHNIVYDLGVFVSVLCIFGTFRGCFKVFSVLCAPKAKAPKLNDSSTSVSEQDTAQGLNTNVKSQESTEDRISLPN